MDICFNLLNSHSEHIEFTRKKPRENLIPFLNVQFHCFEDGYITMDVTNWFETVCMTVCVTPTIVKRHEAAVYEDEETLNPNDFVASNSRGSIGCGVMPQGQVMGAAMDMQPHCIVVGGTVTALCTMPGARMCDISMNKNIGAIDSKYFSFSGSLTTTNIIMANWSKEMWQSVLNRAVRLLSSGPFASQFFSALATVS
ncbi:hypothetical protein KIN20_027169 [Parelaphostrongylus tenuis]|uniref:Uncharacterized protein n=1 Tax=Parelaphostrongylus tenuis TaxID=148309 RepID=A0AAD5QZ15_PARTN|nr:hypothetical protein KIN20_027169 [Parelaphostrongylus tenuis]